MSENKYETDVVIIGAGPVGIFAVFECGMLRMRCHVIDTLDFPGGQCTALYPEKPIYDIPGYHKIDAAQLIEKLKEQAAPFKPTYHLGQQVTKIGKMEDGKWKIVTSKKTEIITKAIIIAAGCGAFGPNRPPIPAIEEYEKTGSVIYLIHRKEDYRGKKLVIAGGGDSAIDWTLSLTDIAEHIYLIHRRDKFRCAPENADKIKKLAAKGKIDLVVPYQLKGLKGQQGKLQAVIVEDLDQHIKEIPADVLMPFYGLAMELGPIAEWGLHLDKKHISVESSTCATNIPGIFAIGDICTYNGKLKLILTGFAEAASAAHAAYNIVYPGQALHFEYSTTSGVPTK